MKRFMVGMVLAVLLIGCADKEETTARTAAEKQVPGDVRAGKAFAERECKGCHGLDGRGAAQAIPHLAAQRERYLVAALKAAPENGGAARTLPVSSSATA